MRRTAPGGGRGASRGVSALQQYAFDDCARVAFTLAFHPAVLGEVSTDGFNAHVAGVVGQVGHLGEYEFAVDLTIEAA